MSDDERTPGYRSGDLEAAARAAREAAVAKAEEARQAALAEAGHGVDGPATGTASPTIRATGTDNGALADNGGLAEAATSSAAAAAAAPLAEGVGKTEAEPPASTSNGSSAGQGILAFFKELPVLLAVAFLLAFLLRTFVVQVFYIPSGSMIPTLEVNDRIVVEKISYLFREPARGEVVVFEGDEPIRQLDDSFISKATRGVGQFLGLVPANARDFVKRVIGLPGDEISITDGVVTVNGVELPEPYAIEDLRDFGPFEVPEGQLFFLGDNRPSSADSRIPSALGYVDMDQVVGRAMVIVWPFEHFDGIGTPTYPPIPEP